MVAPLKIFQKFLFRSLGYVTVSVTGILTLIVWLVQLLRLTRVAAYQSISPYGLVSLGAVLVPRIALVTLSVGFCLAMVLRYSRAIQDKEVVVLSSCGASPWFFLYPGISLACVLTTLLYGLSLYLVPATVSSIKEREHSMKYCLDPSFITPGVFFKIGKRTFYVHKHRTRDLFEGVFIYEHLEKKDASVENIITGRQAAILSKGEGLEVVLYDGTRQQIFPDKPPSILGFKNYTIRFDAEEDTTRQKHVQELSFEELRHPTDDQKQAYAKERVQRLLLPLLPLMDSLWVVGALLKIRRRRWAICAALLGCSLGHLSVFLPFYAGPATLSWLMMGILFWIHERIWR